MMTVEPASTSVAGAAMLQNRVALITGASQGLGRSVALEFVRRGARVALLARRAERLAEVDSEIAASGGESMSISTDVTVAEQVERSVDAVRERFGHIDIVVSNAGMNIVKPIVHLSLAEWDVIYGTNLRAAFLLAKAVLPEMISRRDGQLFFIASVGGKRGWPQAVAYTSAKAALISFSHGLAGEVKASGVRVTCMVPATMNTPWFDSRPNFDRSNTISPDEVARAIANVAEMDRTTLVAEMMLMQIREPNWP